MVASVFPVLSIGVFALASAVGTYFVAIRDNGFRPKRR